MMANVFGGLDSAVLWFVAIPASSVVWSCRSVFMPDDVFQSIRVLLFCGWRLLHRDNVRISLRVRRDIGVWSSLATLDFWLIDTVFQMPSRSILVYSGPNNNDFVKSGASRKELKVPLRNYAIQSRYQFSKAFHENVVACYKASV